MPDFSKKSDIETEIPTASLADMVFVLLLFFMVTTSVKDQKVMVKVDFPHAKNIEKITQKRLLTYIYVGPKIEAKKSQGVKIQIDNAFVTMDEISSIMSQKIATEPRLIVSIRMDKNTHAGVLSDIQVQLQTAGALKINYSTLPEGD